MAIAILMCHNTTGESEAGTWLARVCRSHAIYQRNAGLVLEDAVVVSRFLYPERQGEEAHFERWFYDHGFAT